MNDFPLSLPPLLEVPSGALADPAKGARYEWFEPDGEGGWAAGTAVGANTRREHGLMVVARTDVGDHFVLLARLEETIIVADGERLDLGCNFYPGAIHPEGHRALAGFSLDPWPVWRFRFGARELVRELFRARRAGALVIRYRFDGEDATLEVRPLFAARSAGTLATANDLILLQAEASEGMVAYRPYEDAPAAVLTHAEGAWQASPTWYYRNDYPREAELARKQYEDLFSPGILRLPLRTGVPTTLACGLRPARVGRVDRRLNDELARRESLASKGRALTGSDALLSELGARLSLAADAFMPRAGTAIPVPLVFPDGALRVREALIALPWLARATGRTEEALGLLRILAGHQREGLLPVRIAEGSGAAEDFAAVDAPLWYIEAVAAFAARGHDVKALRPAVFAILDAFERGTSFDIREGADGLLQHGPSAHPLTWMDATAHDRPVTPREGCAVEVNALWHNALLRAAGLCTSEAEGAPFRERAERCREAFDSFWWEDAGWLVDLIDAAGHADRSLRPNQLLAVSLPHPVVTGERALRIVSAVERLLLVPTGVRTLAPAMDGYDGRCHGPLSVRQARRHSGAAWPGWMAPFIVGYLRVHDGDGAARRRVRDILLRAEDWLASGMLGHIAERTCGDAPHLPDGNLASAWSTAGMLEALAALHHAERAAETKPHALSVS